MWLRWNGGFPIYERVSERWAADFITKKSQGQEAKHTESKVCLLPILPFLIGIKFGLSIPSWLAISSKQPNLFE